MYDKTSVGKVSDLGKVVSVKFLLRCANYSRGYTIISVSLYLRVLFKGAYYSRKYGTYLHKGKDDIL